MRRPVSFTTPMWAGEEPVVWLEEGLVAPFTGDRYVSLSSRWAEEDDWPAGYWAPDALAGDTESTRGLMADWRYWGWLWWWKQILAGLVLGVPVLWLVARRRLRRVG